VYLTIANKISINKNKQLLYFRVPSLSLRTGCVRRMAPCLLRYWAERIGQCQVENMKNNKQFGEKIS